MSVWFIEEVEEGEEDVEEEIEVMRNDLFLMICNWYDAFVKNQRKINVN